LTPAALLEDLTVLTFTYAIGPDTRLTFNEKPDAGIRSLLKGAGFRWAPQGGFWWRRGVRGAADFIAALDRKIGPSKPDGACWTCKAPDGFIRPYGAATPVYCDRCHKAHAAAHDKPRGLCPVCGERVSVTGITTDGRLIGECKDAFTPEPWLAPDDGAVMGGLDVDRMYEDACRDACGV
jgi:hypothetical protein